MASWCLRPFYALCFFLCLWDFVGLKKLFWAFCTPAWFLPLLLVGPPGLKHYRFYRLRIYKSKNVSLVAPENSEE